MIRTDIGNAPPPPDKEMPPPACSTCAILQKKHAALGFSQGMQRERSASRIAELERQLNELRELHATAEATFNSGIGEKRPRQDSSSTASPFSPPASRHRPENVVAASTPSPAPAPSHHSSSQERTGGGMFSSTPSPSGTSSPQFLPESPSAEPYEWGPFPPLISLRQVLPLLPPFHIFFFNADPLGNPLQFFF